MFFSSVAPPFGLCERHIATITSVIIHRNTSCCQALFLLLCKKIIVFFEKEKIPDFAIGDLSLFNLNGESEIDDVVIKQILRELLRSAAV